MPTPTVQDIRVALGELTAAAEVKKVGTHRLPDGDVDVVIILSVPRPAVERYLEVMLEHAEEREAAELERHRDALHEAACAA